MSEREMIKESHEKIQKEFIDNSVNDNNWVALESKTSLLLDTARTKLDSNDELITEIEKTLKVIQGKI